MHESVPLLVWQNVSWRYQAISRFAPMMSVMAIFRQLTAVFYGGLPSMVPHGMAEAVVISVSTHERTGFSQSVRVSLRGILRPTGAQDDVQKRRLAFPVGRPSRAP
jgi:hypothetical protein